MLLEGSEQRRSIEMFDAPPIRMDFNEDWATEHWQRRISRIGWLFTSMVHDLRNPLGTVVAGAEMLMQLDHAPTHVKRLATNIYRAAGRMRELLADIAHASRGDQSAFELCDIREVIRAASEAASLTAEQQAVQILNNVPSGVEIPLERSRMECVFFNLMTNALEAMPRGGQIRISAWNTDHCVFLDIEDTGPGIPAAIRDRLFEPFVTLGKDHGLGLGLTLSRQTVRDHGGDMWLEPADGARFVIRLRLNQS